MGNDEYTPLPLQPWATEKECKGRHERVNDDLEGLNEQGKRHDRWLVDLMGLDGSTGRVRSLETKVKDHEMRIKTNEKAVVLGYFIAGAVAAVCAVVGTWLMGKV